MSWQPIETAPMDGTLIDLWTAEGREPNCKWLKGSWQALGLGGFDKLCWLDLDWPPTHWMPMPNPPAYAEYWTIKRDGDA